MIPKLLILWLTFIYLTVNAVDRGNFKTCEQSAFCKRHRAKMEVIPYHVDSSTVTLNETAIEAIIGMTNGANRLKLVVALLEDSTLRVFIDEFGSPLRARYHPSVALDGNPVQQKFTRSEMTNDLASFITSEKNGYKIVLNYRPFRIDILTSDGKEPIITINSKQLLKFEHFREKTESQKEADGAGFWEETFKSYTDTKPFGSSSVGMDISFIGFKFVYGLPEHADSFALRNTGSGDPYRLYNLDVADYELNNGMALYGSIPFVILPSKQRSVGALWLNAAETWVDVDSSTADKGVLASLIDKIRSANEVPQVDLHFMSESGVIDLFLFLGPRPVDVNRQNTKLTGVSPTPPLFSLAYHQCRWNYNDEKDVLDVHAAFDEHDIPVDVIWLDIEHTDDKRYFTWDKDRFSHPKEMIAELASKGRKLVTIIDPHLKADHGYYVYSEARDNGLIVKNADSGDSPEYNGHCWPGNSIWLDYLNPAAREFWAGKFAFDQYQGSTEELFVWNDMNEPSVFSGPEITMHKDARHFGGYEHREVHNTYGFHMVMATYDGLIRRSKANLRPFILSRSFFVGSQRYSAIWTGDNTADWKHLKASVPMLLSLSVSGLPHVGADVGGFFGNPDEQLLVRWYQAGAFQPFFRAHAHIETKRREPWLFSNETTDAIREAIRYRYKFLPYWYTLFYEHEKTGAPVMRPMWYNFPDDESAYDEERQWMIGQIVPIRERARRSSKAQTHDPITLYIAAELDREYANGTIYLDDGESLNYRSGEFLYWGFTYKKVNEVLYTITSKNLDKSGKYDPDVYIEKIVIRGVRYYPSNVHMYYDDYNPEDLEYNHDRDTRVIVIRKPGCYITREWRIDIHCS